MLEKPLLGSVYCTPKIDGEDMDCLVAIDPQKTSPKIFFLPIISGEEIFEDEQSSSFPYIQIRPSPYPQYVDPSQNLEFLTLEEMQKLGFKWSYQVLHETPKRIEERVLRNHPNLI